MWVLGRPFTTYNTIDHAHFLFPSLQLMEECNQLQCELTALQDERDSTFQENMRLQNTLKVSKGRKGGYQIKNFTRL